MSETHLDALLDELVPAEPGPGWDDVLHRARRAQRRFTAFVIVAAALALAPATWAAVRAFEGTPAPPSIKQIFSQLNSMNAQAQAVASQAGQPGNLPSPVDVSKAHGVLRVKSTPYGPLDLWVAPQVGGKGRCWFLSWARTPHEFGGGSCTTSTSRVGGIDVGGQWETSHPSVTVLYGAVSGPVTTLEVELKDGRTTTLPVVEHLALGVLPRNASVVSMVGRDASGKVVATRKPLPEPVFSAGYAFRAAKGLRKEWLANITQAARSDPGQRFANLPESEFHRRLATAATRYGFTVESVRFLRPRQLAPTVVVRTRHGRAALSRAMPAIWMSLDPVKYRRGVGVRPFEAFFFEAEGKRGVPFLVIENEERVRIVGGVSVGATGSGAQLWARVHELYPPHFLFG